MTEFNYRDIDHYRESREEHEGSKAKRWLIDPDNVRWLFKEGRNHTENWAEIVAAEICKLLNIPHAEYHLAVCKNLKGTISKDFLPNSGMDFIPIGRMLKQIYRGYDMKKARKQEDYCASMLVGYLMYPGLCAPSGAPDAMKSFPPVSFFFGYLILDALIANGDRHHQNWGHCGLVSDIYNNERKGNSQLTPSFDHGAAFCKEPHERQKARLETKDKKFSVAAWCNRASTPFHNDKGKILDSLEVIEEFARIITKTRTPSNDNFVLFRGSLKTLFQKEGKPFPDDGLRVIVPFWRAKIENFNVEKDITPFLACFPSDIMHHDCKLFAVEMMKINRERILITLNKCETP